MIAMGALLARTAERKPTMGSPECARLWKCRQHDNSIAKCPRSNGLAACSVQVFSKRVGEASIFREGMFPMLVISSASLSPFSNIN